LTTPITDGLGKRCSIGITAGSFPVVRIAVLGTGTMGAPMARHLASAGHQVRVWNRTRDKAEGLGAQVAATPAEAVSDAEVVITMLADGPTVDSALREALPSFGDAIWAQMSTVGMDWTRRLAAAAAQRGVVYLDAPVLGTRKPAEDGSLVVLVAGPQEAADRCEPVFDAFSSRTVRVDEEQGSATALKLILNHWIVNTIENIGETIAFAQALSIDPRRFLESISGGNMDMPYAHLKSEAILSGNLEPSFSLRLAHKDVGLILEAAAEAGLDLGLARVTLERMGKAIDLDHGEEDMAAAYFGTRPPESG
jgi:3-hydroxyisobutyrate dehydrogenase